MKVLKTLDRWNVRTLPALAKQMDCHVDQLERWSTEPERFFRQKEKACGASGKLRMICCPKHDDLTRSLKRVSRNLKRVRLHDAAHGGRKGRSTKTNAAPHVRQPFIFKLDIKDFYGTIDVAMLADVLVQTQRCSPEVAVCFARICAPFGSVAQGCHQSTEVANIVANPAVERIAKLVVSRRGRYTQYIDDITISGGPSLQKCLRYVKLILEESGLFLHYGKTEVVGRGEEQLVTGVSVGAGIDAPAGYFKEIRASTDQVGTGGWSEKRLLRLQGQIAHAHSFNAAAARSARKRLDRALAARDAAQRSV